MRAVKNYPPAIRNALRTITVAQCTGQLSGVLFGNGFMLAYFLRQNIQDYYILFLFSLIPLISMLFTVPFSLLSDRIGKKRIGGSGIGFSAFGLLILLCAPFVPESAKLCITAGIIFYAGGTAATGSSWFALLSPIVPAEIRGRWFGQMRMTFQTVGVIFSLLIAALLRRCTSISLFQTVLLFGALTMIVRIFIYWKIPELEPPAKNRIQFSAALRGIIRIPGYISFCSYIFLFSVITGAIPNLAGLLQREFLGFSDSLLVVMGNLLTAGTIIGFALGGKMVDRAGTHPVFLTAHIIIPLTLAAMLLRGFLPVPAIAIGTGIFIYGSMQGAFGIAGTSELLALIPPENKSFTTGINLTLGAAGVTLSNILSGQLLRHNMLHAEWILFGNRMSAYDTILAVLMILIALLAVTLGLVPVIRHIRSQWLPQNR